MAELPSEWFNYCNLLIVADIPMTPSARSLFIDCLVKRFGMDKIAFCGIDFAK